MPPLKSKTHGFFSCLKHSLVIPVQYEKFTGISIQRALGYLLLLSFLAAILVVGYPLYQLHQVVQKISSVYASFIPDFEYQNGVVHFRPNEIKETSFGPFTLILANQEDLSEKIQNQSGITLAFLKTKLIFKNNIQTYVIDYPSFSMRIQKSDLWLLLQYLKWGYLLLFILGIGFFVGLNFFYSLLIWCIAILLYKMMQVTVTYKALYVICIFAMTAPILLKLVISLLGLFPTGLEELVYLTSFYYLYQHAKNRKASPLLPL